MGKGRRAIEKIEKKKQGVFVGSKREIVTTMDPAWFVVQSLIFSSSGSSGIVVLLTTTTATTTPATVTMAMMAPLQCFPSGPVSYLWSGSFWLWDLRRELLCSYLPGLASR